jgi:exonuclease III
MDSNGILIWNVRGLNDRAKRDSIKSLVLDTMPSIVCLQETKLSSISDFDIITILGSAYSNFIFSPCIGTRGGILVAWRDINLSTGVSVIKEFSVSVQFQLLSGQLLWFIGVYGPHQDNLKLAFLQELGVVRNECEGPWIIAGDFNMIFRAEDKNNSNINRALLGDFRSWINSMELKELPLCGRRFTWSNQREDPTLVKLDHVFYTNSWEEFFPDCMLFSNASVASDHCPLTLKLKMDIRGKRRFHFESFWLKLPRFLEEVAASWNQPAHCFCPLEKVSMKLRILSKRLQSWGAQNAGKCWDSIGFGSRGVAQTGDCPGC